MSNTYKLIIISLFFCLLVCVQFHCYKAQRVKASMCFLQIKPVTPSIPAAAIMLSRVWLYRRHTLRLLHAQALRLQCSLED